MAYTGFKVAGVDIEQNYLPRKDVWQPGQRGIACWAGANMYGTNVQRTITPEIGYGQTWRNVACGRAHMFFLKEDYSLWGMGLSTFGQLGGISSGTYSPTQLGALTDWRILSCGLYTTGAIKDNGSLWVWGLNSHGGLGLGDRTNRSSPVQVGTDLNWASITMGFYQTLAIKTNGTLWAWGANQVGQLGLNDFSYRSSPVQVGSLTDWKLVSAGWYSVSAVKTDGTLWTWGVAGDCGRGAGLPNQSSPVQVGTLTNWSTPALIAGFGFTGNIKTDGTLWMWGQSNASGQIGNGGTGQVFSPVQIGALKDWKLLACSGYASHAIKTDGTLWAWGDNYTYGQLGISGSYNESSPVQVGTSNTWSKIWGGGWTSAGIRLK